MRTVVIGGMQFMGRRIVELLLERGDDVAVLHRRPTHDLGRSVKNLQADRSDLPRVSELLRAEKPDVVFDLVYDWARGTPASDVEAAARACGDTLQRYVFMSSIAAYPQGLDHREDEELAPDDSPDRYVQHKASTERVLFRLHRESGFPVVTFRPPFVHGPRQLLYREQFFWDRLIDGREIVLPDGGGTPMQWVFTNDIARACVRAVDVPVAVGQAFNMAHLEPLTQRTYVERLHAPQVWRRDSCPCRGRRLPPLAANSSASACTSGSTWICRHEPRSSRRPSVCWESRRCHSTTLYIRVLPGTRRSLGGR